MTKKLLIISVSVGAGHVSAGNALLKYAQKPEYHLQAEHIDMLRYVSLPVRKTLIKTYDLMIRQAPSIWNYFYNKSNTSEQSATLRELTRLMHRINSTELYKHIKNYAPDMILSTHFLPSQAILGAPKKYKTDTPVSLLMTDYDKHSLLITPGMSNYFVATEKIKWKLENQGIAAKSVIRSGIPVDPVFFAAKNIENLRAKYNITAGKKVLVVMSGGDGLAKTENVVETLFKINEPAIIFAIAGNSKKLERKLKSLTPPSNIDLRVIGWTNDVNEYMRVSDVIITKPGGLSTTECVSLRKPIIAVDPIPGQEVQNTYHILENKFGVAASSADDLLFYVSRKPESIAPGYLQITQHLPEAGDVIMKALTNL